MSDNGKSEEFSKQAPLFTVTYGDMIPRLHIEPRTRIIAVKATLDSIPLVGDYLYLGADGRHYTTKRQQNFYHPDKFLGRVLHAYRPKGNDYDLDVMTTAV